jgi:hypothetical protein
MWGCTNCEFSCQIPLSEKAMGVLSTLGRTPAIDMVLHKTGLWGSVKGKVVSHFEEPELLDDLLDHWTSDFHTKVPPPFIPPPFYYTHPY